VNLLFTDQAWEDYLYWQATNPRFLKKINGLLKEMLRTPYDGTGKPEPLTESLANHWSRRISEEHRIVYRVEGDAVEVVQMRYHY
jgi:toxin YoeB